MRRTPWLVFQVINSTFLQLGLDSKFAEVYLVFFYDLQVKLHGKLNSIKNKRI